MENLKLPQNSSERERPISRFLVFMHISILSHSLFSSVLSIYQLLASVNKDLWAKILLKIDKRKTPQFASIS